MNLTEAVALHAELRLAGGDEVTQAVVALHAPEEGRYTNPDFAECAGCDAGMYAESGVDWPCRTVLLINRWLHVDAIGYPE